MGHDNISTTIKYLGINKDDQGEALDIHADYQQKIIRKRILAQGVSSMNDLTNIRKRVESYGVGSKIEAVISKVRAEVFRGMSVTRSICIDMCKIYSDFQLRTVI